MAASGVNFPEASNVPEVRSPCKCGLKFSASPAVCSVRMSAGIWVSDPLLNYSVVLPGGAACVILKLRDAKKQNGLNAEVAVTLGLEDGAVDA